MYYDSFILSFVFTVVGKLKDLYYNSVLARIIKKIADGGKALADGSSIWNFVKRRDYLSKVWEHSKVFRFLSWVLNAPAAFISRHYHKHKGIVKESCFFKALANSCLFKMLRLVFTKYEVVVGVSIFLIAIIPDMHNLWKNSYIPVIAVALLLIYYVKVILHRYEGFNLKAIDFALFAFMAALVVSQVTGLYPRQSMRFFLFYIACFMFVLIISSSMRTGKALNRLIEIMLVGISLTGVYGIYQRLVGVPTDPSLVDLELNSGMGGRIFSTMQNPNNYAEVLVLTIPFFVAVIFNADTVIKKTFFALLAFPPLIALLATGSRSSWIGMAVAVFVFVFLKERRLIPVMIILGILCIPVVKVAAPSIYMRAMTLFNASNDSSIGYRGLIYETVEPMLKDYWITGIGLGSGTPGEPFMRVIQRYYLNSDEMFAYPPHTHNLFLQVWLEVGLLGIVTFIWFIIRMVKNCMISIFSKEDKQINHILMAGVAGVLGNLVIGLAEYNWFYPRTMLFFWINIGIILAGLSILARKKHGLAPKSIR